MEDEKDVLPTPKTHKKESKRKHTQAADSPRGKMSDYPEELWPYIERVKLHNELPGKSKLLIDYSDEATRVKSYLDLPPLEILHNYSTEHIISFEDDEPTDVSSELKEHIFGKRISTYPMVPKKGNKSVKVRDGEPNADHFFVHMTRDVTILGIADGCNWGARPSTAAKNALEGAKKYLLSKIDSLTSLRIAGHILFRAICEANKAIFDSCPDVWNLGTTTILVGLVLPVVAESSGNPEWAYLCACVGDCKTLIWNSKDRIFRDLTLGNRCADVRDPGGRLGPYLDYNPDLRNLQLFYHSVNKNDIIIMCSDGVYDNFDPIYLGRVPRDLELDYEKWEDVPSPLVEQRKEMFAVSCISSLLCDYESINAEVFVRSLIAYAINTTASGRSFMEDNPGQNQQHDHEKYPGKMDHTTAIAFVVGSNSNPGASSSSSSSSSAIPK